MKIYYQEKDNQILRDLGIQFMKQNTGKKSYGTLAHIHDAIELILITEGVFRADINTSVCMAEKGDILLFRSNTIHSIYNVEDKENSYHVVKISMDLITDISSKEMSSEYALRFLISEPGSKNIWKKGDDGYDIIRAGFDEIASACGMCRDIALKIGAAKIILGILLSEGEKSGHGPLKSENPVSELIYKSIVLINERFDTDLSALDISKELNLSYSYFSRMFKRITGKSFREYLNMTRINRAQQMLLTTNKSVTEISSACGYNNVSHFIATYRQIKGITPKSAGKKSEKNT